ncbi:MULTISPECIES: wax ester/triacylglycerol synthase domain-containing protein [Catenuloplanes]|uniref:diacylglycerol O-acyltransferase n=1 Tax=Catenuloplanes niger TaxID=587534 RepID=A0AAE4CYJ0_9ACTN|nr:wax ester/triacylglycerol synthase domain-containing protein [Catenuloplanes niger]MDR7327643.1 WS/DGAT/MGAT family acyltransferase [Catenuloplanes niger]
MSSRYPRLTAEDLLNLAVESPRTPMHMAALAVLAPGRRSHVPLAALRARVERRLAAAPRLRQIIHRPWSPGGRPLWIDDPDFAVARHVHQVAAPPPGDEPALLRLTERLMMPLLDRAHPLWRLWLVTGPAGEAVAVVLVLHHVVTDGLGAIRLVSALLNGPESTAPWLPEPAPPWRDVVLDNVRCRRNPIRDDPRSRRIRARWPGGRWPAAGILRRARGAPRTSLNGPVGREHRLAVLRVDLADARRAAHRHGATINDLVLALATGGLRALLRGRHEPVDGVRLHTSVAVSLRPGNAAGPATGNRAGGFLVRLPVCEPDPGARLREIARETGRAKREQAADAGNRLLTLLSRLGVARWFALHQHLVNLVESDLIGPAEPVRVLGLPVQDIVPVGSLAGNLAVSVLAMSYAGRLSITVQADAGRFPDLPVMMAGMCKDWTVLDPGARTGGVSHTLRQRS